MCKVPKKTAWEKRCWPHHGFATSPEVGPGATVGTLKARYPRVQVSGQDRKARHANHTPLRVVNLSMNRMAQASSGASTCPTDSAPAARPGAAPGPPCVLWPQLPLTSPGKLRSRHVSCGLSSRCPAWGSSGAATCPAASAPAARPGAAPGPPRILWPQLPLPGPGKLWGRHVSCGLSSRCPARGSSEVTTCVLKAQRLACY
jgi:hypothetical protein